MVVILSVNFICTSLYSIFTTSSLVQNFYTFQLDTGLPSKWYCYPLAIMRSDSDYWITAYSYIRPPVVSRALLKFEAPSMALRHFLMFPPFKFYYLALLSTTNYSQTCLTQHFSREFL